MISAHLVRAAFPALLLVAVLPWPLHAAEGTFAIDPALSEVTVSGSVTLELPSGPVVMPFGSQGSGATLPSGAMSNGLTTSLSGTIVADVTETTIRFLSTGTHIEPGISGTWAPGSTSKADTTSAPAQVGVRFADVGLSLEGTAILRNFVMRFSSLEKTLTETGPSTDIFELSASGSAMLLKGEALVLFDLVTPPCSFSSQPCAEFVRFPAIAGSNMAISPATLARPEGSPPTITLPILVVLALDETSMMTTLPLSVTLTLSGQIVAVPEPSPQPMALAVLATLGVLTRLRPRR